MVKQVVHIFTIVSQRISPYISYPRFKWCKIASFCIQTDSAKFPKKFHGIRIKIIIIIIIIMGS
jgi:hypothetical protein